MARYLVEGEIIVLKSISRLVIDVMEEVCIFFHFPVGFSRLRVVLTVIYDVDSAKLFRLFGSRTRPCTRIQVIGCTVFSTEVKANRAELGLCTSFRE